MTLTFRNSQGDLVDIPSVAATKVKNQFGAVLERAVAGGAVAITRHDTIKAVLLSYVEFAALVKARNESLDDLHAEFDDLLMRMQAPAAKKGVTAAFGASPVELGRAAVTATGKSRAPKYGLGVVSMARGAIDIEMPAKPRAVGRSSGRRRSR